MEAIEELSQIADSMRQASALLADEDADETSSSRRPSAFLNVVALGNTGAGKSAVLNSLVGHPALPTGEGGATRAPICVDLTRDGSLSSKSIILQIDSKSQQVSASALRHSLQERLSKISGKSRDEIYLKLRTSTAPPLKLIDLPGVDKGSVDDSEPLKKLKIMDRYRTKTTKDVNEFRVCSSSFTIMNNSNIMKGKEIPQSLRAFAHVLRCSSLQELNDLDVELVQ